jgi:hypothetical protein
MALAASDSVTTEQESKLPLLGVEVPVEEGDAPVGDVAGALLVGAVDVVGDGFAAGDEDDPHAARRVAGIASRIAGTA